MTGANTNITPFEIDNDGCCSDDHVGSSFTSVEARVETFHDHSSTSTSTATSSHAIIEPCNPNFNSHHKHFTFSYLYLISITVSSTLAFMLQIYFIHIIMDMTMRMYFCFPIIILNCVEKLFVVLMIRRFVRRSTSNGGTSAGASTTTTTTTTTTTIIDDNVNADVNVKANANLTGIRRYFNQSQTQHQQQLFFPFSIYRTHDNTSPSPPRIHYWNTIKLVTELLTSCKIGIGCIKFLPNIITKMRNGMFQDIDGEISNDWYNENKDLIHLSFLSKVVGVSYLCVVSFLVCALVFARKERKSVIFQYKKCEDLNMDVDVDVAIDIDVDSEDLKVDSGEEESLVKVNRSNSNNNNNNISKSNSNSNLTKKNHNSLASFSKKWKWEPILIMKTCQSIAITLISISLILLFTSIISAWTYLKDHKIPIDNNIGPHCDPIDTTECLLPFPSSFFSIEDDSTITGNRVHIELDALRKMYRGRKNPKHSTKLNDLDGFSTSGPILFYIDKLKEGHDNVKGNPTERTRLVSPEEIHLSITKQSMTLLLDIDSMVLVPHYAEIDYLDEDRPLVIVQPSKSLEHNHRYAVAVIDATDEHGQLLPVSTHLELLLKLDKDLSAKERKRGEFYVSKVLPALKEAAPFVKRSDQTIQLLFDFHTMSVESQLGNTRKVIEGTLKQFDKKEWDGWSQSNVRLIRVINNDCSNDEQLTARVIHGSIDLPHFLKDPSKRITELDLEAIESETPKGLFTVKFAVTIPCSLATGSKPLNAVVDYGHGFLHSRTEIIDWEYMQRMSYDNGYVIIASNWRGMSSFDLPVIVKAFAGDPNILASVRDNISQGYAFKAGIANFCRFGLLSMDFMKFDNLSIKQDENKNTRFVYYGISQGGILGSAYSSLLGPSKLLDGAAIVSPATPFSTIMSRSIIFPQYQSLMLMNLLHRRHVRIFISMMQSYYDSVEVGGILTSTKEEDRLQTLIQAGIGDATVTTIGTEILSRSYNAVVFPNNPREIYGVPTILDNETTKLKSVLTEVLYLEETKALPIHDIGVNYNPVHACVHSDPVLLKQLTEFINTGNFINVCPSQGCVRASSWQRWNKRQC